MEREFSAGGVVLRKMRGRWFLAVIEPHMKRPKRPAKFPVESDRRRILQDRRFAQRRHRPWRESRSRPPCARSSEETGLRAATWSPSWPTSSTSTCATGVTTRASSRSSASTCCCIAPAGWETLHPRCASKCSMLSGCRWRKRPTRLSYKGEREVAQRALQYVN